MKLVIEHFFADHCSFAAKVILLARIAVFEDKIAVENKVVAVHQVDQGGSEAAAQNEGGLLSVAVEKLMRGVQGDGKKTAFLPLKGLLLAFRRPYVGGAASFQDEEDLCVHVVLDV